MQIVLILHDIRSTHNVGAILRTADGLGIKRVYFSGYTPYPAKRKDPRLPHISKKLNNQIHKTALGAEKSVKWDTADNIEELIEDLKGQEFEIVGLEQQQNAIPLPEYEPYQKTAILLGREVEGISTSLLNECDKIVVIPMSGKKESFNVAEAATMAMYHCRFYDA